MTDTTEVGDAKGLKLENWVELFGRIYAKADADRDSSSLWLDVLDESSSVAEYVRRDEYRRALDSIPDVFGRLLAFVARYSVNATDDAIQREGIDLRPDNGSTLYLTAWVLNKYPAVCSVCAEKPCICPSSRHQRETREEKFKIPEVIASRMQKRKSWVDEVLPNIDSYSVESLFDMFSDIYCGVQHDLPVSAICFHFLEEVGEVANLLLSFNNIQILKAKNGYSYDEYLRYLNEHLKSEIADVVSWTMAIINKVNFIFKSTYPHYHCVVGQERPIDSPFRSITLTELMLRRYRTDDGGFVCPHCRAEECSPQCRENRLIVETEERMKRERDLMIEIRTAMGEDRRAGLRWKTDIETTLDDERIKIVDMGKDNLGFLSDSLLTLEDTRDIMIPDNDTQARLRIIITRPAHADTKATGFKYFYGAMITDRGALQQAN